MKNIIHLVVLFACILLVFGTSALVKRVKQGSPRWQERSEWQQGLLSRIPGAVFAVVILLSVDSVWLHT